MSGFLCDWATAKVPLGFPGGSQASLPRHPLLFCQRAPSFSMHPCPFAGRVSSPSLYLFDPSQRVVRAEKAATSPATALVTSL